MFYIFWPFLNNTSYFWFQNMNAYIQKVNFASTIHSGSPFLGPKRRFSCWLKILKCPKSRKLDGAKNGLRNIRRISKKDASHKINAEGANESIKIDKNNVFILKFCVSFIRRQADSVCPAEILNVQRRFRMSGLSSQFWKPGMLEKRNPHSLVAFLEFTPGFSGNMR